MGFFGIGTLELLLILALALIIWGPAKLPEIARTLGKVVRTLRKASFDLTSAVTKEIENTTALPAKSEKKPEEKEGTAPSSTGEADHKKPAEKQQ